VKCAVLQVTIMLLLGKLQVLCSPKDRNDEFSARQHAIDASKTIHDGLSELNSLPGSQAIA
jgi:hypothetical protein